MIIKKNNIVLRIILSMVFLLFAFYFGIAFNNDKSKSVLIIIIFLLISQSIRNLYKVFKELHSKNKLSNLK